MTRDEIIKFYTQVLVHRKKYIAKTMADGDVLGDDSMIDLLGSVLRELKQPQPDPDTGLMKCGCGGKAKMRKGVTKQQEDIWYVKCDKCDVATAECFWELAAKNDWNGAMGYREADK